MPNLNKCVFVFLQSVWKSYRLGYRKDPTNPCKKRKEEEATPARGGKWRTWRRPSSQAKRETPNIETDNWIHRIKSKNPPTSSPAKKRTVSAKQLCPNKIYRSTIDRCEHLSSGKKTRLKTSWCFRNDGCRWCKACFWWTHAETTNLIKFGPCTEPIAQAVSYVAQSH